MQEPECCPWNEVERHSRPAGNREVARDRLSVLARMPDAQDVDARLPDLVAHRVTTHDDPTYLQRVELLEPFADSRVLDQPQSGRRQGSNRSEERRVGKECGSPCRSRWATIH